MSWGPGFSDYCEHNVKATQRLLEAAKAVALPRLVYASSSSVYGNATTYPTKETDLPHPNSPYGGDQAGRRAPLRPLRRQLGPADRVPAVLHRVRTAPAPRHGHSAGSPTAPSPVSRSALFGDGRQVRDFTYVSDVVNANIEAGFRDVAPAPSSTSPGGPTWP